MYNALKTELWKAFHNLGFALAAIIGAALALIHTAETAPMVYDALENNRILREAVGIEGFGNMYSCSLFLYWMPFTGYTYGSFAFYEIWPILATLPFAWSYSQECRSGSMIQALTRSSRKAGFRAKYLAVFMSGGTVAALPLLISLLVEATFSPAIPLNYSMMQVVGLSNANFLAWLYYSHPWAYCFSWCGVQYLFGGAAAVLSFVFGGKLRFPVMGILLPYAVLYTLAVLGYAASAFVDISLETNIMHMAMAAPLSLNPAWLDFTVIGTMAGGSYIAGSWQVVHHDLL